MCGPLGLSLLLASSFPSGSCPFYTAGNPTKLVVIFAFRAAEVEDGPVLLNEHLSGTRFKLETTETADMLFDHCSSPPRHFLCFALCFKKHDDVSFTDRSHRVAGDDSALIIAVKDTALYLHCLTVHAG
jgi:hypothetical protein